MIDAGPLRLLTARTPAESVDVLVTWVGAAALLRYRIALHRRRERSALERRTGFLVSAIALLLLLRGLSWLRPDLQWLGAAMLVPAGLLPLAMTLFTEGLLRRHVARWIKWLAVCATLLSLTVTFVTAIAAANDRLRSLVLLVALMVTMTVLGTALARRDRRTLSHSENALVRACLLVTLLGLPLVATDFRFATGWPPARLGTIAALLFCYTLLGRPQEQMHLSRWAADIGRLSLRAVLVSALLLLAIRNVPPSLIPSLFVLATAIVFALAIADRLFDGRAARAETALLRWLARPAPATLQAFARELRHLPLTADALLLAADDLAPYDHDALRTALGGSRPVHSLARLREERAAAGVRARGADQLTDLLERTEMTHVALLSERPIRLLLANVPELPGADDAELALAAVLRHGELAVASEARRLEQRTVSLA